MVVKCIFRIILLTLVLLVLLFLISYFTQQKHVDSQVLLNDLEQACSTHQPSETKKPEEVVSSNPDQTSDITNIEEITPLSDEEINCLENYWPLYDNTALSLGVTTLMNMDTDIINNCSYITYEILTDLSLQSAIKQYGNALFKMTPESSYYKDTVTGKDSTQLEASLNVLDSNVGTIVNISFYSFDGLSVVEDLIENHWHCSITYEGLTDPALIMIGMSYREDNFTLYKAYEPSNEMSKEAYEWYRNTFTDFDGFEDTPEDFPASACINFLYGKCCVTIDDLIDSDIIKITVKSDI